MAKSGKGVFFCKECGYESNGWLGQCPSCRSWNTFVEAPAVAEASKGGSKSGGGATVSASGLLPAGAGEAVLLKKAPKTERERVSSGIKELDRVLGGGLVKGSIVLVSGDPGIGKSTLMLMLSGKLSDRMKVLYVSGEESCEQIKMRADRLGVGGEGLYVLAETNIARVYEQVGTVNPDIMIVDSIQTMCDDNVQGTAGSVDTVLYFEGERQLVYRIMRCVKNRFGSTNEIGVFEMTGKGLNEVPNPSATFLEGRPENVPGSAVACVLEGTRPMMVEIQALISGSNPGNARRMCTGVDYNRLSMILAVLEKRLGLNIVNCDAYVNVVGGIKIEEPAADLAIVGAIVSSVGNVPVPADCAFFGEIGLTGEVRAVTHADKRLSEIIRLGFKRCYMPLANKAAVADIEKAELKKEFPAEIRFIGNIKDIRW